MPEVITAQRLRALGACSADKFGAMFPNGSPKTKAAAIKAAVRVALEFDWDWAAGRLLKASAREAYVIAERPAYAAYKAAELAATAIYRTDPLSVELSSSSWAVYMASLKSARETYAAAKARAFAEAYFSPANR